MPPSCCGRSSASPASGLPRPGASASPLIPAPLSAVGVRLAISGLPVWRVIPSIGIGTTTVIAVLLRHVRTISAAIQQKIIYADIADHNRQIAMAARSLSATKRQWASFSRVSTRGLMLARSPALSRMTGAPDTVRMVSRSPRSGRQTRSGNSTMARPARSLASVQHSRLADCQDSTSLSTWSESASARWPLRRPEWHARAAPKPRHGRRSDLLPCPSHARRQIRFCGLPQALRRGRPRNRLDVAICDSGSLPRWHPRHHAFAQHLPAQPRSRAAAGKRGSVSAAAYRSAGDNASRRRIVCAFRGTHVGGAIIGQCHPRGAACCSIEGGFAFLFGDAALPSRWRPASAARTPLRFSPARVRCVDGWHRRQLHKALNFRIVKPLLGILGDHTSVIRSACSYVRCRTTSNAVSPT